MNHRKYRWGMIGLYGFMIIASGLLLTVIAGYHYVSQHSLLAPLVRLTFLLEPFVCGVPAVVSVCRHERPFWPALLCFTLTVYPVFMWCILISDRFLSLFSGFAFSR